MPLETATYITDLVATNPVGATDAKSEGDNHIRMIKSALQVSFPDANAPFYINPGTITVSKPQASAQTWNNAGVTFKARTVTITDTASAVGSLIEDFVVGVSSVYSVTKTGMVTAAGGFTGTLLTAAQPNVTSVGTLTGLTTSGAINAGSNSISGGALSASGNLTISGAGPHAIGGATEASRQLYLTGSFSGSTNAIGLDSGTTLTVPVNGLGIGVLIDPVINKAASGTHTDFVSLRVDAPSIGAGAATLTNATTLKITSAPSVGTNQRALWVAAGLSQFDGDVQVGSLTTNLKTYNFPQITNNAAYLMQSLGVSFGAGAGGANTGTLTNAPSAGNPTKWIRILDNGTVRQIPSW